MIASFGRLYRAVILFLAALSFFSLPSTTIPQRGVIEYEVKKKYSYNLSEDEEQMIGINDIMTLRRSLIARQ